jgi:hypothetical protein
MGRIVDNAVQKTMQLKAAGNITTGDVVYFDNQSTNTVKTLSNEATPTTYQYYTESTVLSPVTTAITLTNTSFKSCALNSGDFISAYFNGSSVRFSRFNSSGVLQGSETVVEAIGSCSTLHVAALTGGGFVVAYQVSTTSVKAAVYDATGTQVVAPFTVATVTLSGSSTVVSEKLNTGGFVIGWTTASNCQFNIYNSSGVIQGTTVTVQTAAVASNNGSDLSIVLLSTGNFAVVYRNTTTNSSCRIFNTSGTSLYSVNLFLGGTSNTYNIKACSLGTAGFAVMMNNTSNAFINIQRYDNTGSVISDASSSNGTWGCSYIPIQSGALTSSYSLFDMAYDSLTGGFNFAIGNGSSTAGGGYYGRFDSAGRLVGELIPFTANCTDIRLSCNAGRVFLQYRGSSNYLNYAIYNGTQQVTTSTTHVNPESNAIFRSPNYGISTSAYYNSNGQPRWYVKTRLQNNDIAIATISTSGASAAPVTLTIVDSNGFLKLQKYVTNLTYTNTVDNLAICQLTNGTIVISVCSQAALGLTMYMYTSTGAPLQAAFSQLVYSSFQTYNTCLAPLANGNFVLGYATGTSGLAFRLFNNLGVDQGSYSTGFAGDFSSTSSQPSAISACGLTDGSWVAYVQNSANAFFCRGSGTSTTMLLSSLASPIASTNNNNGKACIAAPDGGYYLASANSAGAGVSIYKYSAANVQSNSNGTPTSAYSYQYGHSLSLLPNTSQVCIVTSSNGSVYKFPYNLGSITLAATLSPSSSVYTNALTVNNDAIAMIISSGAGNNYILKNYTPIPIAGVATKSAVAGDTLDVIIEGNVDTKDYWISSNVNYIGQYPSGVKGTISGNTAELTRQRNNLG